MGNLLGAPVTEKETHTGSCISGPSDNNTAGGGDAAAAGLEIHYAVSSMQGWRVHMEDAHITEPNLYALATDKGDDKGDTSSSTSDNNNNGQQQQQEQTRTTKIPLPGHACFAVFDGHGGTFAAMYSGRNYCRVLSRQPAFVEYAQKCAAAEADDSKGSTAEQQQQARTARLELLDRAMTDAFVELDREIALALKGQKVPDADTPYHADDDAMMDTTQTEGSGAQHPQTPPRNSTTENSNTHRPPPVGAQLLEEEGDSGTTACVVILTPDSIVCANAGDSRAVMSRQCGRAVPLSYDHKPDDEQEERRIRAAGGYVAGGRAEGDLAVSRGLGDFRFKNVDVVMMSTSAAGGYVAMTTDGPISDERQQQMHNSGSTSDDNMMTPGEQKVSPIPDIIVQTRNNTQDEFILVCCDGIFDVQTNYEAVKTVAELFEEGEHDLGLVCEELCDVCLSMGSKDNMTALIVKLPAQKITADGGGVMARRQRRSSLANEQQQQDSEADGGGNLAPAAQSTASEDATMSPSVL